MTVSFNLSQLANNVNSSGKLDASTGLVNAALVANGGTGRASQTAYAVICGGTTTTSAQQSIASVGTTGQVLTSNGAGALPTFQAATGSSIATMDVKITGTSTWTIPAGVVKVRVTVVGGGGNGVGNGSDGGGGGGGGGAAIKILTVTAGNTLGYSIGGAGTASTVYSGSQIISTITGGAGSNASGVAGGAGGIGSGGDLNFAGSGGGAGNYEGDGGFASGTGGNSYLGGGGAGVNSNGGGNAGRVYGGGGSGGRSSGGAGAGGVIIFEY